MRVAVAFRKAVLNARRHRSGIEGSVTIPSEYAGNCAQRPKASKRDRAVPPL